MIKRLLLVLALCLPIPQAFAQQKVEITADLFTVDEKTQEVVFTGNVSVVNASGTIGAGELVVNLATNVSTFTGNSSGGRVTGVFTSQ